VGEPAYDFHSSSADKMLKWCKSPLFYERANYVSLESIAGYQWKCCRNQCTCSAHSRTWITPPCGSLSNGCYRYNGCGVPNGHSSRKIHRICIRNVEAADAFYALSYDSAAADRFKRPCNGRGRRRGGILPAARKTGFRGHSAGRYCRLC
jgi:hypothetical protein